MKRSKSFVYGAIVIAVANILIKVIGAAYKIPLDRVILHTEGMGIYNSSYTIYNWLFVISTAGLPVAISKLVAESTAKGNHKDAKKIFSISFKLLLIVGLCGFSILFFGSRFFSHALSVDRAVYTMMAMAPSLLFVSLMSAYRGYFQGLENMFPTAISEVIEAIGKLVLGLFMAWYLLPMGVEYASAGAISGVTIGTVLGFIYLTVYYYIYVYNNKTKFYNTFESDVTSTRAILRKLIKIAIPITIGVSVFTLTSIIDTAMVMNQLKWLGYVEAERSSMFGYLGRAITLFNLPPTVISAIAISIVPSVASALALKNIALARHTTKSALRITVIFALPCAVGLSVLAEPILKLVYNDGNYSFLLVVMGIAVSLVTLVQVGNAILQAYGRLWVPVTSMLIGGVVKVIANLILVSHPQLNINGAPIGTFLCYFTVVIINLTVIKKTSGINYEISDFLIKPLVSVTVMGIVCNLVYSILYGITFSNKISLVCAIFGGAIIYFAVLILVRGIKYDDILLMPKGEKIVGIMKKLKIF